MEVIVGSSLLAAGAEKQGNIVNFHLDLFVHLYLMVSFLFRPTSNVGDSSDVYKGAILIGISPPLKA